MFQQPTAIIRRSIISYAAWTCHPKKHLKKHDHRDTSSPVSQPAIIINIGFAHKRRSQETKQNKEDAGYLINECISDNSVVCLEDGHHCHQILIWKHMGWHCM